jgi:uncharacterized protein with HEPN domain
MASVPSERTPTRHPRRAFEHILAAIDDIRRFTTGMDEAAFKADDKTVAAVERCLSRLTEAAFRLDTIAETLAPAVPWKEIRDLGNILRHNYDSVRLDTIWQTVKDDLDPLEAACQQALKTLPPDPP